jgi:hypothetical protein
VGDYLTTEGQAANLDLEMIGDLGFEVVGDAPAAPEPSLSQRVVITSRKKG